MNKSISLLGLSTIMLGMTACQNMPQRYNGNSGYQIESQSSQSAVISYTMAVPQNQQPNLKKLENACSKVLSTGHQYNVTILSTNEIANPANMPTQYGVNIGKSQTSFGLVGKTNSIDNPTARTALNTHPEMLQVIRYQCN